MAFEYSTDLSKVKEESIPGVRSFRDTLVKDLRSFEISLRGAVRLQTLEHEYAEKIIKRGRNLLHKFNELLGDDVAIKIISRDLEAGGAIRRNKWRPETKRFNTYWRDALGLLEEMRWEKNRLEKHKSDKI